MILTSSSSRTGAGTGRTPTSSHTISPTPMCTGSTIPLQSGLRANGWSVWSRRGRSRSTAPEPTSVPIHSGRFRPGRRPGGTAYLAGGRGRFGPGEGVVRPYWRGGRTSFMNVARVGADDEFGLRLWLPEGYPYWRITDSSGRNLHDAPMDQLTEPRLTRMQWRGTDVMIWMPENRPYSVWWFW